METVIFIKENKKSITNYFFVFRTLYYKTFNHEISIQNKYKL